MKCQKCNSELIEYRFGDTTEYICPICNEAPVTQADNLIEFDANKYTLKILAVKNYDRSMLKNIAQICSCNTLEAKKILDETGKVFNPMDALDMRALKRKADELGISYEITPKFNWI